MVTMAIFWGLKNSHNCQFQRRSWDSLASTVTRLWAGRSNPGRDNRFFSSHRPYRPWYSPNPLFIGYQGLFPRAKPAGAWADHSSVFGTEVENERSYNSTSTSTFMPCTSFLLLRRPRGTQFGNHCYASFSIGANLAGESSWSRGGCVVKLWDIRCVVSLSWWATCIWRFGDRQWLLRTEAGRYSQSAYECPVNLIRFTRKLTLRSPN